MEMLQELFYTLTSETVLMPSIVGMLFVVNNFLLFKWVQKKSDKAVEDLHTVYSWADTFNEDHVATLRGVIHAFADAGYEPAAEWVESEEFGDKEGNGKQEDADMAYARDKLHSAFNIPNGYMSAQLPSPVSVNGIGGRGNLCPKSYQRGGKCYIQQDHVH